MAEHSFTVEFCGVRFAVTVDYDPDDKMRYDHLSIKPDGDDADFLDFFRTGPAWPEIDRAIDREWQEWINTGEDPMDRVRDERIGEVTL